MFVLIGLLVDVRVQVHRGVALVESMSAAFRSEAYALEVRRLLRFGGPFTLMLRLASVDGVEVDVADVVAAATVSGMVQEDLHVELVLAADAVDLLDHVAVIEECVGVVVELVLSPLLPLAGLAVAPSAVPIMVVVVAHDRRVEVLAGHVALQNRVVGALAQPPSRPVPLLVRRQQVLSWRCGPHPCDLTTRAT